MCCAPIKSKLQQSPPPPPHRASPGHLNFWRFIPTELLKTFTCKHIARKCYISSFNPFHLVQTRVYSCKRLQRPKKRNNHLKPSTSGSIFPTQPKQRSIPYPREGLIRQIPQSPGTENGQIPGFSREGGCWSFDRRIMLQLIIKSECT